MSLQLSMQGLQNNGSHNVESDQGPTVRQSGPRGKNLAASRRKWTKDDNILLWKCYIKSEPNLKGYRKRFHKTWIEDGGFNVSEQRICDQVRQIEKKEWLTKVEREMIQRNLVNNEVSDDSVIDIVVNDNPPSVTNDENIIPPPEFVDPTSVIPTENTTIDLDPISVISTENTTID